MTKALICFKSMTKVKTDFGNDKNERLVNDFNNAVVDYPEKVNMEWIQKQCLSIGQMLSEEYKNPTHKTPGTTFELVNISVLAVTKIED